MHEIFKYSQTSLSRTRWDCLKTLRYPSIRDIEGNTLKKISGCDLQITSTYP